MGKYLYNGKELPALPERDKTAYPYAVISRWEDNKYYYLYCFSAPVYYYDSYLADYFKSNEVCSCIGFMYDEQDYDGRYYPNWGEYDAFTKDNVAAGDLVVHAHQNLLWSNFDLLDEDGTEKMAATDPIPVYE